jgi:hypothetical protein
MQQVRDNFEDSLRKIKMLNESNYDLKKSIFQEKLKFQHITSLMKEFKIRTTFMVNKINNYRATTHVLEKINKNKPKKKLYIDTNNNDNNNKQGGKSRPLTSIFTKNKITGSTMGTNYSQNNTNSNLNYDINSTITKLFEDNYILFNTEREEEKGKDLKLSVINNEITSRTDGNVVNIIRKRNYEKNIIDVLKKDIEIWNNKIINIINKYKESIPDNQIYYSLTETVEALRQDKNNKFFAQYNNVSNNSMMALPVQNKQFRKIFLELLFRNKNIFEAIKSGQKNDEDKFFNKNLFGAEKIKIK